MTSRRRSSEEDVEELLDPRAASFGEYSITSAPHIITPAYLEGTTSVAHQGASSATHRRGFGSKSRFSLNRNRGLFDEDEKPRRSFCRSWCEMWFLLAQSKVTCIGLSAFLFIGGALIILLTVFGGLRDCWTLHGAVIFCILMGVLSISTGCLCCFYHWVKDDDDLPFAIFCVAYCFLLLFMFITIAGTVVVFTRIHPLGPDQPPPGIPLPNTNTTLQGATSSLSAATTSSECAMVELPLGVLVICYVLSYGFAIMSYVACLLAMGATSDIPPL